MDWLEYTNTINGSGLEGDELFDKVCDTMMNEYLVKYNLSKSMKLINKIEDNPISEEKIANAEIRQNVIEGKVKPSDAKKMVEWNNELGDVLAKNPMVIDSIIL
jgi:hypothetical protein